MTKNAQNYYEKWKEWLSVSKEKPNLELFKELEKLWESLSKEEQQELLGK